MTLALAARPLKVKRNCLGPLALTSNRWCPNPLIHIHAHTRHALPPHTGPWDFGVSEGQWKNRSPKTRSLRAESDSVLNAQALTALLFMEEILVGLTFNQITTTNKQETNTHMCIQ